MENVKISSKFQAIHQFKPTKAVTVRLELIFNSIHKNVFYVLMDA